MTAFLGAIILIVSPAKASMHPLAVAGEVSGHCTPYFLYPVVLEDMHPLVETAAFVRLTFHHSFADVVFV